VSDSSTEVYRDGKVHVRADPCDHCLLSRARLVPGARARELIDSTRTESGATFVCHRNQVTDTPPAICARWWDAFAMDDPILRLAVLMDVVVRTTETTSPPSPRK
jgi:hypothetical protein